MRARLPIIDSVEKHFFRRTLPQTGPSDAVRALADLVASGLTVPMAIEGWPTHVRGDMSGHLETVARAVRLGTPAALAIRRSEAFEQEDRDALHLVLMMHRVHGGDLVAALTQQAQRMQARSHRIESSRSAVAGVVASGRMVAGLPLVMLLVIPSAHAPLFDALGVVTLGSGIALAIAGMRWMGALVPRPPIEPSGSLFADQLAVLLEGGLSLGRAAEACVSQMEGSISELRRVSRRAHLTGSWAKALSTSSDPDLVRVGDQLLISQELGVPAAGVLRSVAAALRADRDQTFEAAMRKAPVNMVVPLVVCVLPAFCLIGLVPFMRAFSL